MSDPIEIILVVALVAYVLIRRVAGQPAQGKKLLLLPVVILAIGVLSLSHTWSPVAVGFLVATTGISFIIGILRGVSVKLFEKDGIVWMRYTGKTVALWVFNIVIKIAAAVALAVVNPTAAHQESSGLLISLGMGILMEGVIVANKALHTDTHLVWAKGKNGEADRHSDVLDNLQRNGSADTLGTGSIVDFLRNRNRS